MSVHAPDARLGGDEGGDYLINFEGIIGSAHNDKLWGDDGNNTLYGGAGNDILTGADGNDVLIGGEGSNQLFGQWGNDLFIAGPGADEFNGGDGTDTVSYENFNEGVTASLASGAGAGSDRFINGKIENLTGTRFDDVLTGNGGVNILTGGVGDDTLSGEGRADTLIGGLGKDTLTGGAGADVFSLLHFVSTLNQADIVTDFGTDNDDLDVGSLTHIWFDNSKAVTGIGTSAKDTIIYAGNTGNSAADTSKILGILQDYSTNLTDSDFVDPDNFLRTADIIVMEIS